jgi:HTH-type transcriptional regulator/antitoxin HigA
LEVTTISDLAEITEYDELLTVLRPRVITGEEQWSRYLAAIDALTDRPRMSDGQREMVALLGRLVHDWEEEHEEPVTAVPQDVVRFLLEENALPQTALVPEVFPNRQNVSEFLAGRRRLSYDRAGKLAAFFHVSPATFYPNHSVRQRRRGS